MGVGDMIAFRSDVEPLEKLAAGLRQRRCRALTRVGRWS